MQEPEKNRKSDICKVVGSTPRVGNFFSRKKTSSTSRLVDCQVVETKVERKEKMVREAQRE